jgi:hypothetical protein
MRVFTATILFFTLGLMFSGPSLGLSGQIRAEGPEFVLTLDDGRVLTREALVGLRLTLAGRQGDMQEGDMQGSLQANMQGSMEVRIDAVDEDRTATGGTIPLYRLSVRNPAAQATDGESGDLCQPDPRGRRAGFPLPDGSGGFTFTCTSGAAGKCVLFGYHPWETREGVPMRDLYQACIHMLRADYGGDDHPTARNGTPVNVADRFGIQSPRTAPGMQFEAAWGPQGAICVSHTRIADNVTLDDLAQRYPQLRGRLGPRDCYEDLMRADPRVILFNQSVLTWLSPK